jgi:hypothetical protein
MRRLLPCLAAALLLLAPLRRAEEASCAADLAAVDPSPQQCGAAFLEAAATELHALQHPEYEGGCGSARLLVLSTEATHFEGLGSVLVAAAEALAEAHAARRTLVLGPDAAAPALLRGATCAAGAAWACYFAPLGACSWSHVSRAEAAALVLDCDSCAARVKASTPTRGAGALYAPPRHLRALLPAHAAPVDAAECWAAALFAHVSRLLPKRQKTLEAKRVALFGSQRYAGAHLREGDTAMEAAEYGGRVYGNKPSLNASELGARLAPLLESANTQSIYLATDALDAQRMADAVSAGSAARVVVLERFRTAHGSHVAAFATSRAAQAAPLLPAELLLPLLAPGGRYAGTEGASVALRDQEAVRHESLEDLYLLAHASALAGTAASHFSVAARLWGLSRGGSDAMALQSVVWLDAEGVASGRLATGFMHGQLNTTFALAHPEQRVRVATARLMDEPLLPGNADVIAFHPTRCVPIVPRRAMRRLRAAWGCEPGAARADDFVRRCVDRILKRGGDEASSPGCGTAAELLNAGADFWAGFNAELAFAAWRAVAALPADLAVQGDVDVAEVARENLGVALGQRRAKLRLYLPE